MNNLKNYVVEVVLVIGIVVIMMLLSHIEIPFTTWESVYRTIVAMVIAKWLMKEYK